jgi:hypothetical protein
MQGQIGILHSQGATELRYFTNQRRDRCFADEAFKPLFAIGGLANICAPLVPAHLLVGLKPRPVQG